MAGIRSTGDMNRVRRLAWQYRDRLNPQDQLFLSLRLGSAWPMTTPWNVQIADAEKAVQKIPESADAWYYLGDALFHYGLLSDVPEPQVRPVARSSRRSSAIRSMAHRSRISRH